MSESEMKVETQMGILKSASEVFEAIVDPDKMSGYFISSGSGRLDGSEPVTWRWSDYGVEATVTPQEIEPDRRVSFRWAAGGSDSLVVIDLEPTESGGSMVKVCEGSWPNDAEGVTRSLQQMQGWVNMLCCLKAYVEHGINLRKGALTGN